MLLSDATSCDLVASCARVPCLWIAWRFPTPPGDPVVGWHWRRPLEAGHVHTLRWWPEMPQGWPEPHPQPDSRGSFEDTGVRGKAPAAERWPRRPALTWRPPSRAGTALLWPQRLSALGPVLPASWREGQGPEPRAVAGGDRGSLVPFLILGCSSLFSFWGASRCLSQACACLYERACWKEFLNTPSRKCPFRSVTCREPPIRAQRGVQARWALSWPWE